MDPILLRQVNDGAPVGHALDDSSQARSALGLLDQPAHG
jgi:hypothetical protein